MVHSKMMNSWFPPPLDLYPLPFTLYTLPIHYSPFNIQTTSAIVPSIFRKKNRPPTSTTITAPADAASNRLGG